MDNLDHFINYDGDILIIQTSPNASKYGEGKFYIDNDVVFIELKGNNEFDDYTYATNFFSVVELIESQVEELFELILLPNPAMDEFEVINNEQFNLLDNFLKKFNLAKILKTELDSELIKPEQIKKTLKKV
jgi:hypothetical protein